MTAQTRTHSAVISLYGQDGQWQSRGQVTISGGRVSLGEWIMGGSHVARAPLLLITRIALEWFEDGADRGYTGWDDQTDTSYRVDPA